MYVQMCVLHVQEVVLKTRGVRSTVDAGSKQVFGVVFGQQGGNHSFSNKSGFSFIHYQRRTCVTSGVFYCYGGHPPWALNSRHRLGSAEQ